MKQKRYICFQCYGFHPEMRGVSEEEFLAGDNVCKEEKCLRKGQTLESAFYRGEEDKMFSWEELEKYSHRDPIPCKNDVLDIDGKL